MRSGAHRFVRVGRDGEVVEEISVDLDGALVLQQDQQSALNRLRQVEPLFGFADAEMVHAQRLLQQRRQKGPQHCLAHVGGEAGGVQLRDVRLGENGQAERAGLIPAVTADFLDVGLDRTDGVQVNDTLALRERGAPTQMDLRLTPRPNAEVATIT